MIAIVDTGGANLASVQNALSRLGCDSEVLRNPEAIMKAEKIILPGVGSAKDSMDRLKELELVSCLRDLKQPTLGICLGMQLLFEQSEEGDTECLGIIEGKVTKLKSKPGITIPHMGWNQITIQDQANPLFKGIDENDDWFYFVHSFVAPEGESVSALADHGQKVVAAVQKDNFFGTQFHPERSSRSGACLLRNFLEL